MKNNYTLIKSLSISTFLLSTVLAAAEKTTPLASQRSPLLNLTNYSEEFKETLFIELVAPFLSAKDLSQLKVSGKKMHSIVEKVETEIFQSVTCDPTSKIYQAYISLPSEWQTPTLIARILMQAEEISSVPDAFGPEMIEFLASWGSPKAIRNKVDGLRHGRYGLEKDIAAANVINIPISKEDKKWVRETEFYNLLYQKKAIKAAHALLNEEVSKGIPQAIGIKFEGLQMGIYRHRKNPWQARKLLDNGIAQHHLAAFKKNFAMLE
ncbi:MAG: hypothetical protein K0M45_04215 [Candidatus Paracaedibacteraceae bacterium]|nr:hypothetical protein [Candidatus Paracaedibacteraceae bacterium]